MAFLPQLVPDVPSLLDPTNPLQNVTFLQNAFFTTFIASLAVETVKDILGESVILYHLIQIYLYKALHQIKTKLSD